MDANEKLNFLLKAYRHTSSVEYRRKEKRVADLSDPKVIEDIFTYHPPKGDQPEKYTKIREAAKAFARVLVENTPKCADQSAAIRHLREAVMTANAAVALEGRI